MKHFYSLKQIDLNKIYHVKIKERNIKHMEELKLFEVKYVNDSIMTHAKIVCAKSKEEAKKIFDARASYSNQKYKVNYLFLDIKILRQSKAHEYYFNRFLNEEYYKQELEFLKGFENEIYN